MPGWLINVVIVVILLLLINLNWKVNRLMKKLNINDFDDEIVDVSNEEIEKELESKFTHNHKL